MMQMLVRLFFLFLVLYVIDSCFADTSREVIVLFKGDQTKVPFDNNGEIIMKTARSFRIPAFVGGEFNKKDLFVVLCDVRYDSFSDWGAIEGASRISYGNYKEWSNVEIFAQNTRKSPTHSVLGDPTAVIKDDKIYVLASSWDESKKLWVDHKSNSGWEPLMVVGTVTNRTGIDGDDVFVKWEKGISLKSILSKTVLGFPGFQFIGGVGNGVVTKNGTIVFPIQISNTKGKYSSSIVYSTDDGDSWQIGNTAEIDSTEASVVEWGNQKLILFSRYDKGYRRVYESDDLGATWEKSLMFSHVWGNDNSRTGVGCQGSAITVSLDGKDILLSSHPLNKKGKYSRDTLQLWISDGQRIKCVGTISEKGKGDTSGYSILAHVGNKLYVTYEINPFADWNHASDKTNPWNRAIAFTPLPKLFESAKNTVRAWRELDTKYKTTGIPAEGLVGFLGSAKRDNSVWDDVYNCVDATVNGGERVIGGFRFNGYRKAVQNGLWQNRDKIKFTNSPKNSLHLRQH